MLRLLCSHRSSPPPPRSFITHWMRSATCVSRPRGCHPARVPADFWLKLLRQTQLAVSLGERTPLSTLMLSAFRMAALPQPRPTSSIHMATKVNSRVPPCGGPRCPAVDTVCADGERLAGRKGLHLQKVIALEPSGALL